MEKKVNNVYVNNTQNFIISVDFDDTISKQAYPDCGELIENAKEVINELYDAGHLIIINTCRMDEPADKAKQFLEDHGIKYHRFNEHAEHILEHYGNDTRKIFADVYIDDKNIGGLPSWKEIREILKEKHNI